jgi:hypothetical protein
MGILDDIFGSVLPAAEPGLDSPEIQAALRRLLASQCNGVVVSDPARVSPGDRPTVAARRAEAPVPTTEVVPRPQAGTPYTPQAQAPADIEAKRQLPQAQTAPPKITPRAPNPDAPPAGLNVLDRAMGILLGTPGEATSFLPGGARDQQMAARNATYKFLTENGRLGHDEAMAALANPALLQQELTRNQRPPESRTRIGPFNQQIIENWNPKAGRWEPEQRPAGAPSQGGAPAAAATVAPLGMAPAGAVAATEAAPAIPAATAAAPKVEGDYVVGPASNQKPAEGYVQKSDGTGKFLWNKDGTPALEEKQGVAERAKERSKSNEDDRNKALSAIESVSKIKDLNALLDKPLPEAFTDGYGNKYETYGDVVGPWAKPMAAGSVGTGTAGQIVSAITSLPGYAIQTARDWGAQKRAAQGDFREANTRAAVNEIDTALTSLQSARVKELFGSSQLSDADREAAAKTVGSINAQDAKALKSQMSIGEKDSYRRIDRALREGLITASDVGGELLARGVLLGLIKPDSVKGRK